MYTSSWISDKLHALLSLRSRNLGKTRHLQTPLCLLFYYRVPYNYFNEIPWLILMANMAQVQLLKKINANPFAS